MHARAHIPKIKIQMDFRKKNDFLSEGGNKNAAPPSPPADEYVCIKLTVEISHYVVTDSCKSYLLPPSQPPTHIPT